MNDPATDFRKRKQTALIALVGASFVLGVVDASLGLPSAQDGARLLVTLLGNIALLVLGFRWLHLDSSELDIRRPTWLNVCIVLFAAVFVPYYLYKTRPQERRVPAIAAFFALVVGCMLATGVGASLALQFGAPTPTP